MTAAHSILNAVSRKTAGDVVRPPLTSLVDMMVILLVFLLKSFSVDGQLVTPAADLQLPPSSTRTVAEPALSVEVTAAGISIDGIPAAALPALTDDDLLIADLHAVLVADPGRRANIQCDRRVDFAILKRVLYTCDQAGIDDLALLVLQEAS